MPPISKTPTLLLGATLLTGCGHPRHIDPTSTPAYGSSPSLSSPDGFVAGKWMRHVDLSGTRRGILANSNAARTQEIDFQPNGVLNETVDGYHALGRWVSSGNGVDLRIDSVDGKTPDEIERDKTQYDEQVHLEHERKMALQHALVPHAGLLSGNTAIAIAIGCSDTSP